jgi:hypothetical protein
MYVLKYTLGGPDSFEEYTYQEAVQVTNKIAITENPLTRDSLIMNHYEYLGEIDSRDELDDFLYLIETGVDRKIKIEPTASEQKSEPEVVEKKEEKSEYVSVDKIKKKFTPDTPTRWY